jgi:hypothetical protein
MDERLAGSSADQLAAYAKCYEYAARNDRPKSVKIEVGAIAGPQRTLFE